MNPLSPQAEAVRTGDGIVGKLLEELSAYSLHRVPSWPRGALTPEKSRKRKAGWWEKKQTWACQDQPAWSVSCCAFWFVIYNS